MKMLAIDLGASSGRAMLGQLNHGKMELIEIHRFSNTPVYANGVLYWDILRLLFEIKESLKKCVSLGHADLQSIGIDTWGVDFGLLDKQGYLLENPIHYRDSRNNDAVMNEVLTKIGKERLYNRTGIQQININTIFQLYSLKKFREKHLNYADKILFIPDLLNYYLTGQIACEYTVASTSGLINLDTKDWDEHLIEQLDLPRDIFPDIKQPGSKNGQLLQEVAEECGIGKIDVILSVSHDTGSAVVSTPLTSKSSAYISCGTWSLIGKELKKPLVTNDSYKENYTNEGGYNHTVRFLKNISGLYLLQEVKKSWELTDKTISYDMINKMIEESTSSGNIIDPDHPSFATPGNMVNKINSYLIMTKQKKLESKGDIARCILESLALTYKKRLITLEEMLDDKVDVIHLVGGGARNKILCQFTANSTNKTVIAGPVEATAIGNIVVQMISNGVLSDMDEARRIIKESFEVYYYYPNV